MIRPQVVTIRPNRVCKYMTFFCFFSCSRTAHLGLHLRSRQHLELWINCLDQHQEVIFKVTVTVSFRKL